MIYTKDLFVEKASRVHKKKYDYSRSVYVDSRTKIIIICPIHGKFSQVPNAHLMAEGCPKCGRALGDLKRRLTISKFIYKAHKIYDKKYDYSKVKYKDYTTKIKIGCPVHGGFFQSPRGHLQGGCKRCASLKKSSKEFIKEAKIIHGNRYDYSKVNYLGVDYRVLILCKKHGKFLQFPRVHLKGGKCQKCYFEEMLLEKRLFIQMVRKIYGYKFSYKNLKYLGMNKNIKVICKIHGSFSVLAVTHLNGGGCPKCHNLKRFDTKAEFIKKARKIHKNKYDYSKVVYKGSRKKVNIICKKHGLFLKYPTHHISLKSGCPFCSSCKLENEFYKFLKSIYRKKIIRKNRIIIGPKELDFLIPEKKLAIEFNGLFWHSSKIKKDKFYHLKKFNKCQKKGLHLIEIYEDSWVNNNLITKKYLINYLKGDKQTILKRPTIKYLDKINALEFIKRNSIEIPVNSNKYLGLMHKKKLFCVISFSECCKSIKIKNYTNCKNPFDFGPFINFSFFLSKIYKNISLIINKSWINAGIHRILFDNGFRFIRYTGPEKFGLDRYKRNKINKNSYKKFLYSSGSIIYKKVV